MMVALHLTATKQKASLEEVVALLIGLSVTAN